MENPPKVNRTVPYRAVPCSGKAPLMHLSGDPIIVPLLSYRNYQRFPDMAASTLLRLLKPHLHSLREHLGGITQIFPHHNIDMCVCVCEWAVIGGHGRVLTLIKNISLVLSRGVTRHLSHETIRDTRLSSRERDEIFSLFFKSSMMKYIGKIIILFNWKTQNAKKYWIL